MGSNRDWGVSASSLILPPFAGPGDPQIDIGTDNPADLVAYYAGFGDTLIQSIIYRANATAYTYIALVISGGLPFMAFGSANATGVNEMQTIFQTGANPELILGSGGVGQVAVAPGSGFTIRGTAGFAINNVSQGRGRLDYVSATTTLAAVAAETVVLTSNASTFVAGRAYSIEVHELHRHAGGSTEATVKIRRTNLAGAIKLDDSCTINSGDSTGQIKGLVCNFTAANITDTVVATIAPFPAGTVQAIGSPTTLRWMEIRDYGAATDYPGAIQI